MLRAPITLDQVKDLKLKTLYVDTPLGKLNRSEFRGKDLKQGVYFGFDEVMGPSLIWRLPFLTKDSDATDFNYAIENIHTYEQNRAHYQSLIKKNGQVKWNLIQVLICGHQCEDLPQALHHLPKWNTPALLNNKELFKMLVEDGALYKHCLAENFFNVNHESLEHFIKIFGLEGITPTHLYLNPLTRCLLANDMKSVKLLVKAGTDVNARTDLIFNNTHLHYLIALEREDLAIAFIELVERARNKHRVKLNPIDFTLQDNQEKTALLLAVGLGFEKLVTRLLKLHADTKFDVGINTPDKFGRTPVMIAAALGMNNIRKMLIAANADMTMKDHNGRNVEWYMTAPIDEIRAILTSVSVNPDRGYYCSFRSYLYSNTTTAYPWVLVDQENREHLLLLTASPLHFQLLQKALSLAPENEKEHISIQMKYVMPEAGPHYAKSICDKYKMAQEAVTAERLTEVSTTSNSTSLILSAMPNNDTPVQPSIIATAPAPTIDTDKEIPIAKDETNVQSLRNTK